MIKICLRDTQEWEFNDNMLGNVYVGISRQQLVKEWYQKILHNNRPYPRLNYFIQRADGIMWQY